MIWWFLILALGAGAVLWVGIAIYLRIRRHMKANAESHENHSDLERQQGAGS